MYEDHCLVRSTLISCVSFIRQDCFRLRPSGLRLFSPSSHKLFSAQHISIHCLLCNFISAALLYFVPNPPRRGLICIARWLPLPTLVARSNLREPPSVASDRVRHPFVRSDADPLPPLTPPPSSRFPGTVRIPKGAIRLPSAPKPPSISVSYANPS